MIPIECPNCGKEGRVPPDRLNARLVCKGCNSVFHMDNTGHMILGEPGSSDAKPGKSRGKQAKVQDVDFAQTWNDIPKPVRFGVPAMIAVVIGFFTFSSGESVPSYLGQADSIMHAVASNDRSPVISYSSSDNTEATGKWFDVIHGEMEKKNIGSNVNVSPALLDGNPDRSSEIQLMVVVAQNDGKAASLTLNLQLKRESGAWKIEGAKSLADAKSAAKKSP